MVLLRSLVTVLVIGALPVAIASAAVFPSKGYYGTGGEGGGSFSFTGTKIARNAVAPSKLKCNSVNAVIPKSIAVRNNAFRYSGKLKGQPGTIIFKGHWKTNTTIAGSATVTNGSCTSKKSFTATYSGPAMPMVGVPGS